MEKVLQILLVTALLMLVIWRSIRGRDEWFRPWSYLVRVRAPLPESIGERLLTGTFGPAAVRMNHSVPDDADAWLLDEEHRILLCYRLDGKITIFRLGTPGGKREFQEMSVPMDCSALAWDPEERKIYLEEGGYWYVYAPEGQVRTG
ncbi:MAG TPA: hypothetical protein VGR89_07235 [Puia sp.]|nr:hypothetical protein [Puia sp.]